MESQATAVKEEGKEATPVDPGCLPAWSVAELPAPVPFQYRNLLALLGPGIVLIGTSMGTGEWIMGPQTAAKLGGAFLIVVPIAIICQVILNTEVMRYTLLTGEPIFTGFMRSKPGPRFWLLWYLFLDFLGWWPSLAGLSAQILLFAILGPIVGEDPTRQKLVLQVSCVILVTCALLLCFGGKIYNTIEVVLSGKVFFALGYTLFVTLIFVPWEVWSRVLGGLFNPMVTINYVQTAETKVDWTLIATLAGYAGVGGMGNTVVSNFVREKGWGMGSLVGAIPSAFGGHQIALSHLGTITRNSEESLDRFKRWWTYILVDQYGFWAIGSVVGMLLPCVLGMAYLQTDYIQGMAQWEAAASLARDIGARHGEWFTKATLLCGFVILFPGQFGSMDSLARRWCDAFWSGSRRARAAEPHKIKHLYYSFVFSYTAAGIFLNLVVGISPPKMMQISGNLANLALLCCLLHTLYVNTHFLPEPFRPSMGKRVAMVLAACVYVCFFTLSVTQIVPKIISGELFR